MKTTKLSKKGQLGIGDIPLTVRILVILGITIAVGLIVLSNIRTSGVLTTNSPADFAAINASASLTNISVNLPLVGTIIGLVIVLGVVLLIGASRRGL